VRIYLHTSFGDETGWKSLTVWPLLLAVLSFKMSDFVSASKSDQIATRSLKKLTNKGGGTSYTEGKSKWAMRKM
jgi:hypothetical protein